MSDAGFDTPELCFHPRLLGFFLLAIGALHIFESLEYHWRSSHWIRL